MQEVRGRGHGGSAEKHREWEGGLAGKLESAREVNWRLKLDDMIQRDH